MKLNWILRIKNKVTLTAIIACLIGLVYQTLGLCGIVPSISQEIIIQWAGEIINLLVLLGVVVDPTTKGADDSELAQGYSQPN